MAKSENGEVDSGMEYKPLFRRTGNPFADTGLAVLCQLSGKAYPEDLSIDDVKSQVEYIIAIYSHKDWGRAFYTIFPNSELANPSIKDGPDRYSSFMRETVDKLKPAKGVGNCTICGMRDGESVNKTRIPLLGSGKFVNFFPSGVEGEWVCPNCIISVQFMPIGIEKVGTLLLIHTNAWPVQLAYAGRIVDSIKRRTAAREGGVLDTGYKMRAGLNAIYNVIGEIVQSRRIQAMSKGELVAPIRFYRFTNYGQGPDVEFYDIPSNVFRFFIDVMKEKHRADWRKVVKKGYRHRKRVSEEDAPKRIENKVYRRITEGKNILPYFFEDEGYRIIGDWELVSLYLRRVRMMKKERIDVIKKVADRFLAHCQRKSSAKRIGQLNRARNYRTFRSVLLKIQQAMAMEDGESLVDFDQYVLDLAPEGGRYWRETRDLLLFRIYEQGASWLTTATEGLEEEMEE